MICNIEKITAVFYNNDHFKILIYFKGTKISSEVSLSSFVEDFFNSFNAYEPIILDWLKSNFKRIDFINFQ